MSGYDQYAPLERPDRFGRSSLQFGKVSSTQATTTSSRSPHRLNPSAILVKSSTGAVSSLEWYQRCRQDLPEHQTIRRPGDAFTLPTPNGTPTRVAEYRNGFARPSH
ncbi:Hypothetical protein NTJ_15696 [Nesidiocoris tenuis]|uniref:Uncharacterized protein n=1 Tax=Nesidiocoris tenuis TaxID=355587 RepID=A0ABN7BF26_9HEMI|nr:Hypothetical protein NTJ_15696 [Nesidiocoris tenuis]